MKTNIVRVSMIVTAAVAALGAAGSIAAAETDDMHWSIVADTTCPDDMHWSIPLGLCVKTDDMHW